MIKQSPIYDGTEENYLELANAIIIQACKDYKALYYKKRTKKYMHLLAESDFFKLEKFFRSEWFDFLSRTCIDGETLIKHLQEEVQNEIRIENKRRKR